MLIEKSYFLLYNKLQHTKSYIKGKEVNFLLQCLFSWYPGQHETEESVYQATKAYTNQDSANSALRHATQITTKNILMRVNMIN